MGDKDYFGDEPEVGAIPGKTPPAGKEKAKKEPPKPKEPGAHAPPPKEGEMPIDPESFFTALGADISIPSMPDVEDTKQSFNIEINFHDKGGATNMMGYVFKTGGEPFNIGIQIDPDKLLAYLGNTVVNKFVSGGWKGEAEDNEEGRSGIVGRSIEIGAPQGFRNLFANVFKAIVSRVANVNPKFRIKDSPAGIAPKKNAFGFTFAGNAVTPYDHYGVFRNQLAKAFPVADIKEMADKGLVLSEGTKTTPLPIYKVLISQFVGSIPEDKFKKTHPEIGGTASKLVTKLTDKEIEQMKDGKKVLAYMKEHPSDEDQDTYKYVYSEEKGAAVIENKRLTNKMILEHLVSLAKGKSIVDLLPHRPEIEKWVGSLAGKVKDKVEQIFGLGIKKEAYGVAWAGPTLEEIGKLIGTGEAQWASELAAKLAATLDYISYPSLVGSPTELKKIALWLTREQSAFVQKNLEKARAMMHTLAKDIWDPISGEPLSYERPQQYGKESPSEQRPKGKPGILVGSDTLNDIADEALLELVSEGVEKEGVQASVLTLSEEDFLDELRKKLGQRTAELLQRGRSALPEEKTSPEDIYAVRAPESYEPVVEHDPSVELPEEMLIEKKAGSRHPAVLDNGTAVQITSDPDMPLEARGRMGTIAEALVSFGYCEEHKQICPFVLYRVEYKSPFRGRRDDWFSSADLMPVASLNKEAEKK